MVTRKYTKDYRIETILDRHGKLREKVTYCGSYYRFTEPFATVKKHLTRLVILTILLLVTVLLPMIVHNDYLNRIYVFIPHGFTVIPLYLFGTAIYRIITARDREVIREHRDKILFRLQRAGVFLLIVSILSVLVIPVYLILETPGVGEWSMMAMALLRMILAWFLFSAHKEFAMEERPPQHSAQSDAQQ